MRSCCATRSNAPTQQLAAARRTVHPSLDPLQVVELASYTATHGRLIGLAPQPNSPSPQATPLTTDLQLGAAVRKGATLPAHPGLDARSPRPGGPRRRGAYHHAQTLAVAQNRGVRGYWHANAPAASGSTSYLPWLLDSVGGSWGRSGLAWPGGADDASLMPVQVGSPPPVRSDVLGGLAAQRVADEAGDPLAIVQLDLAQA